MHVQCTCSTCGTTFTRKVSAVRSRAYCSPTCYRSSGQMRFATAEERFWAKVDKHGPIIRPDLGPCWIWLGAVSSTKRGSFSFQRRVRSAHVVAYILTTGHEPPPETPCILHHCDGGDIGCIRPSHLYAGTKADNGRDAVERGRTATGDRSTSRLHPEVLPRGEQARSAKLTDDLVREIRRLWAEGNHTQVALGAIFGVSGQSINAIVLGKAWKHLL